MTAPARRLSAAVRATAQDHAAGVDVRVGLSRRTFQRHRAALLAQGVDIGTWQGGTGRYAAPGHGWPSESVLLDLARRARAIACRIAAGDQPVWVAEAGMDRAVFVGLLSDAFDAVLFSEAESAGVRGLSESAQIARGWVSEVLP